MGKTTVVLGGQAGSEGKGKFAGYLALKDNIDFAVANFMPNAGHTWVGDDGTKVMVQQLPQAVVNDRTVLAISAGAAIEPEMLLREIEKFDAERRTVIHPRAVIIRSKHRRQEGEMLNRISSTLKGCGFALADKVSRHPDTVLAGDLLPNHPLHPYVIPQDAFETMMFNASHSQTQLLIECPQGFDLDINHGLEYPYCTSRQTITAQAVADAGLPPQAVHEVIAVIRPYPIRVGDAFDKEGNKIGTSGSYLDSEEISWEIVAERSGTPLEEISELTTVTQKLRRVFEPNWDRLRRMVRVNGVTQIALNFANYIDYDIKGKDHEDDITEKVQTFIDRVEDETGIPVTLIGTGAKDGEIIDIRYKAEDWGY